MKIKSLVLAAGLALSATGAFAENQFLDLTGASTFSDGISSTNFDLVQHSAGAFTDTILFSASSIQGLLTGNIINTSFGASSNIDFTKVTLNGNTFTLTNAGANDKFGFLPDALSINGPVVMQIFGVAAPLLAAGSSIAADMHGSVNIAVAAVPEPETYAMLLAGLGLLSVIALRRKKAQSKPVPSQLAAC